MGTHNTTERNRMTWPSFLDKLSCQLNPIGQQALGALQQQPVLVSGFAPSKKYRGII